MAVPLRAGRASRALAATGIAAGILGLTGLPAGAASVAAGPVNPTGGGAIPPVHHVWTIVLENSDESATLAQDNTGTGEFTSLFTSQGAFIPNYFATGHSSLDNYIALAAAQGPTPQTQGDCSGDNDPVGGDKVHATFDADGQALGTPAAIAAGKAGCTYPADVPTIGTQLSAAGYTWKTYAQGMDDFPKSSRPTCQSAQYQAGDPTQTDRTFAKNYARKHDPELYFYGVTGIGGTAPANPACDTEEVGLLHLNDDLVSAATTPSYSLIIPDLCNDAHDSQFNGVPTPKGTAGCKANSVGPDDRTPTTKAGIAAGDDFLAYWVPRIMASPAYADNGLVLITFDEGTEAVACCGEIKSPNLPVQADNGVPNEVATDAGSTGTTPAGAAGLPAGAARGGGQIGMVAISPFITPGTTSLVSYNHFSYVRTIEDMFHLTPDRTGGIAGSDGKGHIGYAGSQGGSPANAPASFGTDVFDNPTGGEVTADLPESRLVVLLPISGILLGAAVLTRRMRRAA